MINLADDMGVYFQVEDGLAIKGCYYAKGMDEGVNIPLIPSKLGNHAYSIGGIDYQDGGGGFLIRLSDIAKPAKDDQVQIGDVTYKIGHDPALSPCGNLWRVHVYKGDD